MLKSETHHRILEDIFLKESSFFKELSVSYKKADVFQVEKASIQRDIKVDQIKKYQNLSHITYITLDNNRNIFDITIVVLFQSLSPKTPAGIWNKREKTYPLAV
jgi:hypothetical protein